jgi:hypothetical protein
MKVKPLEWEDKSWIYRSLGWNSVNKKYRVLNFTKDQYSAMRIDNGIINELGDFPSEQEAKSACQKHWEGFILSCIV